MSGAILDERSINKKKKGNGRKGGGEGRGNREIKRVAGNETLHVER